uniref:Methyltransferase FkbM domain-containing protein n=1 Tax=Chaetoceros debilis TaxID=122233 RepID=A0A7S3PTX9_9STRA
MNIDEDTKNHKEKIYANSRHQPASTMINRKQSGLFPSITAQGTTSSLQGKRHRKKLTPTLWVKFLSVVSCAFFVALVCYGMKGREHLFLGEDADPSASLVDQAHQETNAVDSSIAAFLLPTNSKDVHNLEEDERARQSIHQTLHNYGRDLGQTVGTHEVLLSFLLSSILKEEDGLLLPEGTILDCGAQFGEQGAHYAVSSPHRKVISMDPSPKNVQLMKDRYGSLTNFEIRHGGLGREVGTMKPRDNSFSMDMNSEFPVYTLDSMYFDKGLKLALAHLDLEGLELETLLGGLKTIRAYKPVFTVELRVHETEKTTPLLDLIAKEGYDTYVIDEPCGMPPVDLRNILCIPRDRSTAFGTSDAFNILLKMKGIQRITSDDIAKVILPCCALGGECCQGNDLYGKDCCTESVVLEWHKKHKESHVAPIGTLAFKEGRQDFLRQQYRLRKRNRSTE